jgi:integrase
VFSRDGEPIGYKWWAAAFLMAAKKAGVPTASLHGLRHSLATYHRESGVSDEHIRAAFGRADAGIQERYTHRDLYDLTKQSAAVTSLMGGSIE